MNFTWRPIEQYKAGPYRGFDECVLLGFGDIHGRPEFYALAFKGRDGKWMQWNEPSLGFILTARYFACIVQDIEAADAGGEEK